MGMGKAIFSLRVNLTITLTKDNVTNCFYWLIIEMAEPIMTGF